MKNEVAWDRLASKWFSSARPASRSFWWIAMGFVASVATMGATNCRADDTQAGTGGNPILDYFVNWFPRVTQIQSEQPHWVSRL
jgi:hypothetical protein